MKSIKFGKTAKQEAATCYTLVNEAGIELSVSDYGATLVSLFVPDKHGVKRDVVLGYPEVKGYEENEGLFFGATVGRSANRISGASFVIEGTQYILDKNANGNNLHSGSDCYNKRMWQVKKVTEERITFYLDSKDGDQGYPGNVGIEVTYALTADNEVRITYSGTPDKDTVLNMTNHSYFNLDGHASGDVLEHKVWIDSDYYTRTDAESIPTGEMIEVAKTPMDFHQEKKIGAEIDANYEATQLGNGYDHNFALKNYGSYQKVAQMSAKDSGIVMEIYTDLPGMQLYTGNFIVSEQGKEGAVYKRRQGACFETQYFPNAVNQANFQSPIVKAGVEYKTTTGYKFI